MPLSDDASKSQQGLFDVKVDQRSECSGYNAEEKASTILGAEIRQDKLNGDHTKVLPCMIRVSPASAVSSQVATIVLLRTINSR